MENTFADELGEELFEDYFDRDEFHHVALERLMEQPDSFWFDDVNTPEVEGRDRVEYHPMQFDKASIEADKEGVLILTP